MRKRLVLGALLVSAGSLAGACGTDATPEPLCPGGQVSAAGGVCLDDFAVATNTVGFLPERMKRAAYEGGGEFEIVNADSGDVVLSGTGEGPIAADGNIERYVADFTEVREPGRYYVRAGGSRSATFEIGAESLREATRVAMLGLYGQRSGVSVEYEYQGNTFKHGPGHLEEAIVRWDEDLGFTKDDTGGWYDAGDYGKYVRNGAFSVGILLQAWEQFPETLESWEFDLPEKGGDVPDILDEARVELEWILKTQYDDGSFAHKVTAASFEGDVMPTGDAQQRYFFSTSTHSTAQAIAVLAAAARIYEEFDADFAEACLEAAESGYEFLDANEEIFSIQPETGGTGLYGSGGDIDERAWAAVELWETTGKNRYLEDFEAIEQDIRYNFDWPDGYNLAATTYLGSERDGRDPAKVDELVHKVVQRADMMVNASTADPFGRGFDSYYWGSAGITVRMSHTLIAAHKLFPNEAYLDAITSRLDHVLGLNPFARSFVTGVGSNPPQNPHHRPSRADGVKAPWPGLLIGGPNGDPTEWSDIYSSYQTNEIAINWNTALIYALVAAVATQHDESADCVPNCLPDTGMGGAGGAGGSSGQ